MQKVFQPDIYGKFVDYLFVAQQKQVLNDGNNFVWRQKPNTHFTVALRSSLL